MPGQPPGVVEDEAPFFAAPGRPDASKKGRLAGGLRSHRADTNPRGGLREHHSLKPWSFFQARQSLDGIGLPSSLAEAASTIHVFAHQCSAARSFLRVSRVGRMSFWPTLTPQMTRRPAFADWRRVFSR